ncbi:hypothetical protein P10VF_103 [Rhizobium phage vB_RleM_P10VF]|uniref:Uncharacterized protein n=1 Tax=Rhizobium phage vB_RleM_P10VF TaxID=1527770 RepID=A0A076YQ60_9CAUD|nr:hypothetical protein P10VF_103 [Rhizobium phage vB_RleM_P10VF]AIK68316.1 hypothetical protein P10VF_103 [Rhizobium phage vB_RleM_P10VF]
MEGLELRRWAKEEVIDAIDKMIRGKFADKVNELSFDERYALIEQRNRAAKIYGLDQKGMKYFS